MKYDIESIEKRKDITSKLKKLAGKIVFMIIILLIYNILLVVSTNIEKNESKEIFGYKAYIIVTDSMKPNINIGDIVIVKKDESKLNVGNVITYKNKKEIVTHRIVGIKQLDGEVAYITKGDNNNIEDSEKVYFEQIEGSVITKIPYLGKVITLLKNKTFDIIVAIAIFIIYIYILRKDDRKKTRREKKKVEDERFKIKDIDE